MERGKLNTLHKLVSVCVPSNCCRTRKCGQRAATVTPIGWHTPGM